MTSVSIAISGSNESVLPHNDYHSLVKLEFTVWGVAHSHRLSITSTSLILPKSTQH